MRFNSNFSLTIRKAHRYLGLFLGIQFLFWTISGLYFSWTDLDEIHGDHFKNLNYSPKLFKTLISPSKLNIPEGINTIELNDINGVPHYWINNSQLYNANNGNVKKNISETEALYIASKYMIDSMKVSSIEVLKETNNHHEYRGKPLPAYVISYSNNDVVKAYISANDGKFQTVRHRSWRWFDFLWMGHTMDYAGRDNFNNLLLRIFSLFGLFTVISGFLLWGTSSPTLRKIVK